MKHHYKYVLEQRDAEREQRTCEICGGKFATKRISLTKMCERCKRNPSRRW